MLTLYKKLISSKIFKDWNNKNKDSFLCSFVLIDNPQFDFYNKNDTMTSFMMKDKIEVIEDEEIYNETKIKPLQIKDIKSSEDKVIEIIKDKYPKEKFGKEIIILQNQDRQLWNITIITASLKLLNVKVDMNNKIVSETFEPLTKFMKKVK